MKNAFSKYFHCRNLTEDIYPDIHLEINFLLQENPFFISQHLFIVHRKVVELYEACGYLILREIFQKANLSKVSFPQMRL